MPGLLVSEVAAALREFIVTGFETETAPFKGEFQRRVQEQHASLFRLNLRVCNQSKAD